MSYAVRSLLLLGVIGTACGSIEAAPPIDFSRDVLPILSDACFQCHGPDEKKREADLRLDEEASTKRMHDDIAAVVPGKSGSSELIRRLLSNDPDVRMPPPKSQRKLNAAEIETLRRWIDEGAVWGGHWSFRPIVRPPVPPLVDGASPALNPIDAFIQSRLEREKLKPSAEAPAATLARRATLDLTGLPPTDLEPGESYERLVERLLASPAFGERMAWDWLDAARYADSNGYQGDGERTMWPWRDWVVESMNRNQPYDEFTVWQLAGDLLPNATVEQKLATGFCRNHAINGEGGRIGEENRVDYVMDMTETTGTVWLGLTFNCCRCHDHKFDPLANRDYFGMFAFFNQTPVDGGGGNPQTPPVVEFATSEQRSLLTQWGSTIQVASQELDQFEATFFARPEGKTAAESEAAKSLPDSQKAALKQAAIGRNRNQLAEFEKQFEKSAPDYLKLVRKLRESIDNRDGISRAIPRVMVMAELPQPRQTFLLDKGLYDKRGAVVTASVPAKLPRMAEGSPLNRLGLAQWVTATDNPLTARVTVNRIWQQFFGIGLVKTAEDFGVQGQAPVHPELLDWLAAEFIASGWDVKGLCRLIVTSATYRQSSKATSELIERDPENRLLARGARYRMPAWMIRDQALAVSGLLVGSIGGAPVKPYQPTGVWEEATFGGKSYRPDSGSSLYRRSLYTFWRRIVAPTMFFDSGSRQFCTVKQLRTNTPLHALLTLNDVTFVEAARVLAQRVLTTADSTPAARLNFAINSVLARSPSPAESEVLSASLARLTQEFKADPDSAKKLLALGESKRNEQLDAVEHAAWTGLCLAILNLDEAVTKE